MDKNFAKVRLSAEEMRLVTDPAWILTKNSVMGKVVEMFAELSEAYKPLWADGMKRLRAAAEGRQTGAGGEAEAARAGANAGDAETLLTALMQTTPKISKGENYKGLPWVILDYPRLFGHEDIFAIRTMFWWGHAFSLTLHLKGKYKEMFMPDIERFSLEPDMADFMVSVSDDEWRHEHVPENYQPLLGGADLTAERKFIKLSAAFTLDDWDNAPDRLAGLFLILTRTLF